ncbi:MAG: hypothetical protein QUS11_01900 [Candidatus Fermentibacter sp.]|nr:hypothetical protein [Candidatus Fermentibacter sp.]
MSSGVRDHAGLAVCAAGIGCFIALIGHALGYVLSEGGSVASGGPYAVARPAPAWIMILPVSIILLLASGGASMYFSRRLNGPGLLPFAWAGLFGSLGYRFAEAGSRGGGPAAAWVVCGFLFITMGIAPLAWIPIGRMQRRRLERSLPGLCRAACAPGSGRTPDRTLYWTCAAFGAVSGVITGFLLYRAIAG